MVRRLPRRGARESCERSSVVPGPFPSGSSPRQRAGARGHPATPRTSRVLRTRSTTRRSARLAVQVRRWPASACDNLSVMDRPPSASRSHPEHRMPGGEGERCLHKRTETGQVRIASSTLRLTRGSGHGWARFGMMRTSRPNLEGLLCVRQKRVPRVVVTKGHTLGFEHEHCVATLCRIDRGRRSPSLNGSGWTPEEVESRCGRRSTGSTWERPRAIPSIMVIRSGCHYE